MAGKRREQTKAEAKDHPLQWLRQRHCPKKDRYLSGPRIRPPGVTGKETADRLVDQAFLAYNGGRLREACQLLAQKILAPGVTVGLSLAGALTPAGLGPAAIVPLIKAGFVDWIVATGANLYHDLHFAFDLPLHQGQPFLDDADLARNDVVRIYDVLLDFTECLIYTDELLQNVLQQPDFQGEMGTAELHHLLGRYAARAEEARKLKDVSVLAAAYRAGVPVYTSSPGDSTIGLGIATLALRGSRLVINPSIDVNETTAIVLDALLKPQGRSAAVMIGGGSPKNFLLQTEPQIQDILREKEVGHDYFLQVTDARPDTGGLSGATPQEAVSWSKLMPDQLGDAVVCYTDSTIALPLLAHYALARAKKRQSRRLYDQRDRLLSQLNSKFHELRRDSLPPPPWFKEVLK